MENTRYYNVTNEPYFWCPARKDDQQEADDGRFLRSYLAFGEKKQKWGWPTSKIEGIIEFAQVQTSNYQDINGEEKTSIVFQVAVQAADRVEVLNLKFYDGHPDGSAPAKGNAKILVQTCDQIDLGKPVTFEVSQEHYTDKKGKEITYYKLNVSQGKFVKWSWTAGNGKKDMIPLPEVSEGKFGTTYNYEKQNEFFLDHFEKFVKKVELECAGVKASREPTPAEAEKTAEPELAAVGEDF